MKMGQAMELLGTFTAEQWGMVTTPQAKDSGVDGVTLHRLEKAGHLDRVRHGVYAATTATLTEAREEQAAWLALNASKPAWKRPPLDPAGGVLSHQSAAFLHGLGELVNERITLTTPRRRTSRDPDLWFKTSRLAAEDVTLVDGLPVTTALRTICDLLEQHIDGSHIATIIRQAVEANQVQLDVLAEHIGPYALRYGVRRPGDGEALLDQLLREIGTTTARLARRPAPLGRAVDADAVWGPLTTRLMAASAPLANQYAAHLDELTAPLANQYAKQFDAPIAALTSLAVRKAFDNQIAALTSLAARQLDDRIAKLMAPPAGHFDVLPQRMNALRSLESRGIMPTPSSRTDDTQDAISSATPHATDNDDGHGSKHAEGLPRLPDEQGEE